MYSGRQLLPTVLQHSCAGHIDPLAIVDNTHSFDEAAEAMFARQNCRNNPTAKLTESLHGSTIVNTTDTNEFLVWNRVGISNC